MSIDTIEPNAAASAMPSRALKIVASVTLDKQLGWPFIILTSKSMKGQEKPLGCQRR